MSRAAGLDENVGEPAPQGGEPMKIDAILDRKGHRVETTAPGATINVAIH